MELLESLCLEEILGELAQWVEISLPAFNFWVKRVLPSKNFGLGFCSD